MITPFPLAEENAASAAAPLMTAPLGPQIYWKAVDIIDAPTPGPDVVPAVDAIARKLSIPAGTQFYAPSDGTTPVVKLGATSVVFSAGKASATQYLVKVSTGGVPQWLRVNSSAVTVIASSTLA